MEKFEYKLHNLLMSHKELLTVYPGEKDKDKDVIQNRDKVIVLSEKR